MNNHQAHERVHKLLHDGKINPEEATALLEALTDTDTAHTVTEKATSHDTSHSTAYTTSHGTSHGTSHSTLNSTPSTTSHDAAANRTPPTPPEPPRTPKNPNTPKDEREVEINLNGTMGHAFSEVFSRGFRYAFGIEPDGTANSIPNPDPDTMPDTPFVYVHNRLGNVTIKVDATLTEPRITPKTDTDTDTDEVNHADIFRPHDQESDYPKDMFMVRLLTRADSTLHLPEGYAVVLDSGAGNVRVHDVDGVFGTVNAGNANITGVTSLNLVVNAGNAKVEGRFDEGEHRLVTNAGNAKVILQEGSSLTVNARVTAGNIKHQGDWHDVTVLREMVSSKLEGRIHTGNATLTLKAKAGNISIHAPDGTTHNTDANTGDGNTSDGNTGDDNDD